MNSSRDTRGTACIMDYGAHSGVERHNGVLATGIWQNSLIAITLSGSNAWGTPTRFERAKTEDLKEIFFKYASEKVGEEWFMSSEDFIRKYLGLFNTQDYAVESVQILAGMIDTSKDGLISFKEFQAFEGLLCVPDALYNTAFQLFDKDGNGIVSCDEFEKIIKETTLQRQIPFNLDGHFVRLYFGEKKDRVVTYAEFSQFIHDFHEEYAAEAFRRFDVDKSGCISVEDFFTIMTTIRSHLLTSSVKKILKEIVPIVTGENQVSFPFFIAFNTILSNVELAKKVYLLASKGARDREVTKEEFQAASNLMSQITPLQSNILFALSQVIHQSPTIIYSDFEKVAPEQYYRKVQRRIINVKAVENPEDRNHFIEFLESAYRFSIGVAAGAVGAVFVYPMDLVKTRMQLNRPLLYEGRLYKNTRDCLQKVAKYEGYGGFYRGLVPQVVGVALGKAIKLTINDFIRDKFMNRKGLVPRPYEILAGASAGFFNVFFIHPLEAIKIQIQIAGQIDHEARLKTSTVVRNFGITGLYRGFTACCLRDVPFCAIFFPLYAHMKVKLQDEDGYNSATSLLMAGIFASIPGALTSMPFDKIKTRLQAEPLRYSGIGDVARKIYTEEGPRAFWQGTRLIKPSSQFGVTLLVYEILQRLFYIDFAGTRPTGSEKNILVTGLEQVKSDNPDHIGGYALALPIISGIETKFGLLFPKFKSEIIGRAPTATPTAT